MEYANQYNNPNDLHRAGFNQRQFDQQRRGGSWSQPPWDGWKPIIGAGFLQRYAQDGDSGFFHKNHLFGRGEPFQSPFGLNHLPSDNIVSREFSEPSVSTIEPLVYEPSPMPENINLIATAKSEQNAEPEQRALHVPPYSHLMKVGFGKDSALYEDPFAFEPPKVYGGSLHRKKKFH